MEASDGETARFTRRKLIARLHQSLEDWGMAVFSTPDVPAVGSPRGGAYFMRFIPEETCYQLVPGFPRYFQEAQRHGLTDTREAMALGRQVVLLGASLRDKYAALDGRLLRNLQEGRLGDFLDSARDPQALRLLEAEEHWFPDILHAQLRWPCVIGEHMKLRRFYNFQLQKKVISTIAQYPLRALTLAVDLVTSGLWLGLGISEISQCLRWLESGVPPKEPDETEPRVYAEGVLVPCFAPSAQGLMVGFFRGIREDQKDAILSVLSQSGRCFADLCATERKAKLRKLVAREGINAKTLADIVLDFASPVEHAAVSVAGTHCAYVLQKEANYLTGYAFKTGDEAGTLAAAPSNEHLTAAISGQTAQISVSPLRGYDAIDPIFYWPPVKTALSEFLSSLRETRNGAMAKSEPVRIEPLELDEIERTITALQHHVGEGRGSRATAKRLCFMEAIKAKYDAEEATLSNKDMRNRMQKKLPGTEVMGYQVTGEAMKTFEGDIEGLLPGRFRFEILNHNVIRIKWRKSVKQSQGEKEFA